MLRAIKYYIKSTPGLKRFVLWLMRIVHPIVQIVNLRAFPRYVQYIVDWLKFRRAGGKAAVLDFYPCLFEKTESMKIDAHYFYQAVWAFKKIFAGGAKSHIDVGSDVKFVGMLTAITKVTFVDIRPLFIELEKYSCKKGSILALPFEDETISSISSLHVVEHIGLGRYGDPIDPHGPEKACEELGRVLAPGGQLYFSVPIGEPRVQFNGQRVFSISEVLAMLQGLQLKELSIVDAVGKFKENLTPDRVDIGEAGTGGDFGLGMFAFEKPLGD